MKPDYSRQGEEPHRNPDQYDAADMQVMVGIANELLEALDGCAKRLEKVIIFSGSDEEYAAEAVQQYRDLIAKWGGLQSRKEMR